MTRVGFFRRTELSSVQLVLLFLLKVAAGIFYAWLGLTYKNVAEASDTWSMHWQGVAEYHLLLRDPVEFFTGFLHSTYPDGYGNFFSTTDSWWNDVKLNAFLKFLGILNIFSFGYYYLNVIIYSFITFYGVTALYQVMKNVFPLQKIPVLIGCFLLPSFILWTSGVHKEGLIFLFVALIVFHLYFGLRDPRPRLYRWVVVIFSLLLILLLRNFMVMVLVPALIAWFASHKLRFRPVLVFLALYLVFVTLFFTAKYIHPSMDLPAVTADRQASFLNMRGRAEVAVEKLEPTFQGFLTLLPQVIYVTVLSPSIWDIDDLQSLAASAETYLYLLLLLLLIFYHRKERNRDQAFILFCIFFGFSVLLMVGYTVNNLGAIVRYRSLALPFLLTPVLASLNWPRLGRLINI